MADEADSLRAALAARLDDCWDRFDDAATELLELHLVPIDELVARARALRALAAGDREA